MRRGRNSVWPLSIWFLTRRADDLVTAPASFSWLASGEAIDSLPHMERAALETSAGEGYKRTLQEKTRMLCHNCCAEVTWPLVTWPLLWRKLWRKLCELYEPCLTRELGRGLFQELGWASIQASYYIFYLCLALIAGSSSNLFNYLNLYY